MLNQAGGNSFLVSCHIKGDYVNLKINVVKVSSSASFPISKHVNKISKTVEKSLLNTIHIDYHYQKIHFKHFIKCYLFMVF